MTQIQLCASGERLVADPTSLLLLFTVETTTATHSSYSSWVALFVVFAVTLPRMTYQGNKKLRSECPIQSMVRKKIRIRLLTYHPSR